MHARLENGVAEVELTIAHPMQTGHGTDATGANIAAHFIQLLQAEHNGKEIMQAQWGTGVARDPYLVFYVAGAMPGDTISVAWHDNKGQTGQQAIILD